ncbi:MAG TPA: HEAT repeat domain-containing protein [Hanamia sp.]|nr:HEAT repeat domain-containing protein [Hanamia sp.]
MKIKLQVIILMVLSIIAFTCASHENDQKPVFNPHPSPAYLSPEESLKSFYLPKGYHIELVASEPMIKDPVAITWDGDGRMYVAEMLTYMEDADATGERLPWSRIMLLEDTNHDGKMDKSTVFVDSLLLPRMMQSVGNSLLVNETNSITITSYTDTNGDGKADVKKIVYQNDKYVPSDENMEHQRSGLDWNLDNWMYMTYEPVRFRYTNGTLQADSIPSGVSGQWGLTHDNYGRLFFSSAGGETPALGFQINPVYGQLDFPDQLAPGFDAVWPIIATPDVQGGNARLRPNNTLNHFTACSGQSIYRGDGFPKDFVGDYIVCEPVGRIVRRAKVYDIKGETFMKNAYDSSEFISSSDMNFRPVNSATGPDGDLYIVDMYHGIIQQGNWTKPGSFLRNKIDSLGLAKNIGRGRIYRVVYDGIKSDPKPDMLEEPTTKLLTYLGNPNGWWRDNAQKLIIVRGDLSVVPALKSIATGQKGVSSGDTSHLARIHALWTLEGLNSIDKGTLTQALNDPNPQVRKTAVWISETYLKKNDSQMIDEVAKLENDPSYDVRVQVLLSMYQSKSDTAKAIVKKILEDNADNKMIVATKDALDKNQIVKALSSRLGGMTQDDKNTILDGAITFRSLCANCHGADGKGLAIGGGAMAAPPLVGASPLKLSEKYTAMRILLGGLTGPVEGKTYPAEMPSMAANRDGWIADVLSYARYEFGNKASGKKSLSPIVKRDEVKKIREEMKGRTKPWTLEELKKIK